ncbi:replication-relaxation family protein [Micromonospora phytophila]|nr:replication-relaxation family protein [Micromonospora phytophila]
MGKHLPTADPLLRLQASITALDDRLLGWLYDHGVFTTDQIAVALFPSLDFTQRRLRRLTALRAVDRFRPNKADGGSHPYHYSWTNSATTTSTPNADFHEAAGTRPAAANTP